MAPHLLSYAQNAEDIVLWRAFSKQPTGFWVDVGAYHPVGGSVTRLFSGQGWRGINIEPTPTVFEALKAARPNDINLNLGISSESGTLRFWVVDDDLERSTFDEVVAAAYQREGRRLTLFNVPVTTLDDVLERHVPPETAIDFLKIDAEGFEARVLRGLDLARWKPTVIVAEALVDGVTPGSRRHVPDWEPLLTTAGYRLALDEGLNRFYVHPAREDVLEVLSRPAMPSLDDFAPWLYVHQTEEAYKRVAERDADVADLTQQLERARQRIHERDDDVAQLAAQLESARSSVDVQRLRLDQFTDEVAQLTSALEAARAVVGERDGDVGRLTSELEAARAVVGERDGDVGRLTSELEAARAVVGERDGDLARLGRELALARARIDERDTDVAALTREVEAARLAVDDRDGLITRLQADADALRRAEARVRSRVDERDADVAMLTREVEAARAVIVERDEQAMAQGRVVAALAAELERVRRRVDERDGDVAMLTREVEAARAVIIEREDRIRQLDAQVQTLQREVAEANRLGAIRDLAKRSMKRALRSFSSHEPDR